MSNWTGGNHTADAGYSVEVWRVRHLRRFLPARPFTVVTGAGGGGSLWERAGRRAEEGEMSELLTTGEAAALLGVSKPTLVRAVQRGDLRPALVTPGLHRRFRREELLAYRSRLASPPPAAELRAS